MATILTFSPLGEPRRPPPPADACAEVIVFPRTDIRALQRLSDAGDGGRPAEAPGDADRT